VADREPDPPLSESVAGLLVEEDEGLRGADVLDPYLFSASGSS
jgi:hypothetical protein